MTFISPPDCTAITSPTMDRTTKSTDDGSNPLCEVCRNAWAIKVDGKGRQVCRKCSTRRIGSIRSSSNNIRRNDPCPCGSGKKFKKCHLRKGANQ